MASSVPPPYTENPAQNPGYYPQNPGYPPQKPGAYPPPQNAGYPPPNAGGYPPPPNAGGYGQPQQPYYPPPQPMMAPPQQQQQQSSTVVVVGGHQVAGTGNCPICRNGFITEDFTCCGICLAIFFFPIGLICCLLMKEKRCTACGSRF